MRPILSLTLLALLATGCSAPSHLYRLEPLAHPKGALHPLGRTVVGIAEVQLADYLHKNAIVLRESPHRFAIRENDLWAGNLAKNIQRTLAQELTALVPGRTFLVFPWDEPLTDRYRIYLSIDRFDADEKGVVVLSGRWSLVDMTNNRLVTGERFDLGESVPPVAADKAADLDRIVAAQNRLLHRLARHIARSLRR